MRPTRTAFGGVVTADTSRLTTVLAVVNVAVFLVQLSGADLALRFGMVAMAAGPDGLIGVADGQWYRLLSAAFLHGGTFHLLSNLLALVTVGPPLEAALGRARFLVLYVLSALGGSVLSYLLSSPGQLAVGASGALFGLFGAYYVVVRRSGGDTRGLLVLLAINLALPFFVPLIDWRAHLGGLAVGAAVGAVFAYAPAGPRRATIQAAGAGGVLLLLLVVVVLRTAALTL